MSERPLLQPVEAARLATDTFVLAMRRQANLARLAYIRRVIAEVVFIAGLILILVALAAFLIFAMSSA